MKLAIAYSTKDKTEQTEQTALVLLRQWPRNFVFYWIDGSSTEIGRRFHQLYNFQCFRGGIYGGPDAAIAYKLSHLLAAEENYTHIGILENDVLLDEDWFEPTMTLFEKGEADGLAVGAVSARSYVDRVLIQREGYAVMHNVGAGFIIFTREAAEIVLRSFRTHWYPATRWLFAQISGIDLNSWIGFREWTTTDWGFEAQLAGHGLATLALTPSKAQMPWEAELRQHTTMLTLTEGPVEKQRDNLAFERYRNMLERIRSGQYRLDEPGIIHRQNGGMLFFPHQLGHLPEATWQGTWGLKWSQGFGPFLYRAGPGGASLSARISGSCSFLLASDGAGATATLIDTHSGFRTTPPLSSAAIEVQVPGGPVPRIVELNLTEGALFCGLLTADPQVLDTTFSFSWDQLPEPI